MAVVHETADTIADETKKKPWQVQKPFAFTGTAAKPVFETSGICAVTGGDNATSTYRLVRLPSNARVTSLKVYSSGTCANNYDFGVYAVGGVVKVVDAYAADIDLSTPVNGSDLTFSARSISTHRIQVWEDANDLADPVTNYELVATSGSTAADAGYILAVVQYVLD